MGIFKMIIFKNLINFSLVFVVCSAGIKDDDLEQKLRKFQSLTGISETKYKELWDKRDERTETTKAMKMRLSQKLTVQWQRPIDPVQFDILEFNKEMDYSEGLIIITDPGFYQFTVNFANLSNRDLAFCLTKNGRDYAFSKHYSIGGTDTTLSLNTLMDLDVFDMISVKMTSGDVDSE